MDLPLSTRDCPSCLITSGLTQEEKVNWESVVREQVPTFSYENFSTSPYTGSLKFLVKVTKNLEVPLKAVFDFGEFDETEAIEEIVLKIRDKDGAMVEKNLKVQGGK